MPQKQLSPAGSPRIEPQSMDEGQDLKYVATFEVFPEVVLQPIETLQVDRLTAEVTESDVDAMIERLRKQQMKYVAVSRPAAIGDKVSIDFEGAIDGVAFAGGKGENIGIVLGEGRMLPQLEQGLIGATLNEKRDISVNFPGDYRATELAGKLAIFATEIKAIEEPVLPEVDEEFCTAFGVTEGGIPKLREDVAANMRRELDQALRNRNKTAVMEKLYQANPIDVPNVLIESPDTRHAGGSDAPQRRQGPVAGAAARTAARAGAAPRDLRAFAERSDPAREPGGGSRASRMSGSTKWSAPTAMPPP